MITAERRSELSGGRRSQELTGVRRLMAKRVFDLIGAHLMMLALYPVRLVGALRNGASDDDFATSRVRSALAVVPAERGAE
jgi:lipopolysaccharide/colanic/teichoic acid biosynthesis glycosyltransferase